MPEDPEFLLPVDTDTANIADGDEVLPGTEAISQDPNHLPEGTATAGDTA